MENIYTYSACKVLDRHVWPMTTIVRARRRGQGVAELGGHQSKGRFPKQAPRNDAKEQMGAKKRFLLPWFGA